MCQCVSWDPLFFNTAHRFPAYVSRVRTTLETLQAKVIRGSHPDVRFIHAGTVLVFTYRAQWLAVFTVKTSMLVHGILEMSRAAEIDREVLAHLRSKAVWAEAFV
jgi:hypothetical protein